MLNPFSAGRTAQKLGAQFEAFVRHMAMTQGLLHVEHGLRARRLRDRVVAVKSDLDVFLAGDATKGEVAFFDCKSFQGRRFGQGMLTAHQRQLALRYAEHGIVSGFVVLLREANHVGFYPAQLLTGRRAGFGVEDGVRLGTLQHFILANIWRSAA